MKIYDISQEVFSCAVFPGDPAPKREVLMSIASGDHCNLTAFSMCAHNGTHIDAPCHFIDGARPVDRVDLVRVIGPAFVAEHSGEVTAAAAEAILSRAASAMPGAERRILIKGRATVSLAAAEVFAGAGVFLVGNESQTVGPEDAPAAVHRVLLGREVVLLEGVRLGEVPEGGYLLSAAPINLAGADGAPCRAVLIDLP